MKKIVIKTLALLAIALSVAPHTYAQPKTHYEIEAADGAWCWFSDPRAVYHKGAHERIYYGYINSQGDVVISTRDLKKSGGYKHLSCTKNCRSTTTTCPRSCFCPTERF